MNGRASVYDVSARGAERSLSVHLPTPLLLPVPVTSIIKIAHSRPTGRGKYTTMNKGYIVNFLVSALSFPFPTLHFRSYTIKILS